METNQILPFSIEDIPFPVLITDDDQQIIEVNTYFYTPDPLLLKHKNIKDIFCEWIKLKENDNIILGKKENSRFIFIKSRVEHYNLFIGMETEEIYEIQHSLSQLELLNRELDTIIDNSYDGIYITDRNGITIKTNTAIERITGIPKEYYVGKPVDQLIKRGILKASVTHRVVEQKRTVSLVQENFEGKETLITGNPVLNENGEIEKVVTNIRDMSELNELFIKLNEANKLNYKYKQELDKLKKIAKQDGSVVFASEKMKVIYDMVERISDVDATILILGETGVGKDVLARFIYNESNRSKSGDFIKVNCGAIPNELLESELFGYDSGAFTGANRKGKPGMFELADKGILFLDEIGELPLALQVKLLRVLQEREIQRIGSTKVKPVDVRVIAATNRDLKKMVEEGNFREDLFYRLNVIPITIPSLKDRKEDVLVLAELFLSKITERYKLEKEIGSDIKDFFYNYNWPGNVRELNNLIERLVLTTKDKVISIEDLPFEYVTKNNQDVLSIPKDITLKEAVEVAEKKVLSSAIQKYKSTYEIAKHLESSQATIVRKLKKYNLKIIE